MTPINLATRITLCRLFAVPALLALAYWGHEEAFLWLLLASFASDVLDGYIARQLQQESELGARIDTWSDAGIYLSLPLCGWWLWPELITAQATYVAMVMTSIAVPVITALLKFHHLTSYHTWGSKLAALTVGSSTLLMFAMGITAPFQLASMIALLAGLEQAVMTLLLQKPRHDLPSIWHALRIRQLER